MRVITQIPNTDLRAAQQLAQIAERAGFDSVITAENAPGPFLPLAAAALVTERVQLGTAVAMAFPRSPTIMAHSAWDLHKASNGRFYLGLGAQVKAHNERRFGIPWTPPGPRMRDYIAAVRAVWHAWETETPLDFHSDTYNLTLMTPNFSPKPTGLAPIPISIAAVGPAMLKLGGEMADGVRLHPFSTRRYRGATRRRWPKPAPMCGSGSHSIARRAPTGMCCACTISNGSARRSIHFPEKTGGARWPSKFRKT